MASSLRALQRGAVGCMRQLQDSLPRLPVPDLSQSLQRYVEAMTPIVGADQLERTKRIVKEFGRAGGQGEQLQRKLKERAKTEDSWLSDWWLQHNFLADRSSIFLYDTGGGILPLRFTPRTKASQLRVASRLLHVLLDIKEAVDNRSLIVNEGTRTPQCPQLYFNLFATCREPGDPFDRIRHYSPEESRHVVVVHNSQHFELPMHTASGERLSPSQLFAQLQRIVELSPKNRSPPRDECVGFLTAEPRDVWAKRHRELCSDPVNAHSVHTIQSAAIYLSLDHGLPELLAPNPVSSPNNDDEHIAYFLKRMLTGCGVDRDSGNKWLDKSIHYQVSEDGIVGSSMEHAAIDGSASLAIQNYFPSEESFLENLEQADESSLPQVRRLEWNLTPSLREAILTASNNVEKEVNRLVLISSTFEEFGKSALQGHRVNADSFMQIAIQLAYFRLHGETVHTHESSSTRQFKLGRTETIRSASIQSAAFVRAVDDSSVSLERKGALMRAAVDSHFRYIIQAINGQAFDRHLFGLRQMAIECEMDMPEIFTDKTYIENKQMRVYTSQTPGLENVQLGFAPYKSVKNGYGVGYKIADKKILLSVSCYRDEETDCRRLASALRTSLVDLKALLPHLPPPASKL